MRRSSVFGAGLAACLLAAAAPAEAEIINVSSLNGNGTIINLGAGTYRVRLAGLANGGAYDAWSPWTFSSGCNASGANCTTGYLNAFAIDFGFGHSGFVGADGFQFGYVPQPGNSGLYETAALALAAYRTLPYSFAPLTQATDPNAYSLATTPYTFTLAAPQQVRFFVLDYPYSDNRDGFSLDVSPLRAGGVPEPATWAALILGFGVIGTALRQRRTNWARVAF